VPSPRLLCFTSFPFFFIIQIIILKRVRIASWAIKDQIRQKYIMPDVFRQLLPLFFVAIAQPFPLAGLKGCFLCLPPGNGDGDEDEDEALKTYYLSDSFAFPVACGPAIPDPGISGS